MGCTHSCAHASICVQPEWPSDDALGMWSVRHSTWTWGPRTRPRACSLQHNGYHPPKWLGLHGRQMDVTQNDSDWGRSGLCLLMEALQSPEAFTLYLALPSWPIIKANWVGSFFPSSPPKPLYYSFMTYFLFWVACDITLQWFLPHWKNWVQRDADGEFTWGSNHDSHGSIPQATV